MGKHPNRPIETVYETAGNVITDALELLHSTTSHGISLDLENIMRKAGPLALKIDAEIVRKNGPTDDETMDIEPKQKIENVIGPKDPSVLERLLPSKRGPLSGHDRDLGTAKYMMTTNEVSPYTQFTHNYTSNILPHETPNTMTNIPLMIKKMQLTHDDLRRTIADQDEEIKKMNEEQAQEAAALQKQIDAMNMPPVLSTISAPKISKNITPENLPYYKNSYYKKELDKQPHFLDKIKTSAPLLDELNDLKNEEMDELNDAKRDVQVAQKEGELQVAKAKNALSKLDKINNFKPNYLPIYNQPRPIATTFRNELMTRELPRLMSQDPKDWIERIKQDRDTNLIKRDEAMRTREEILKELEDLTNKSKQIDEEIAQRTLERERMDSEEDNLIKLRDERLHTELEKRKKYYDELANNAIQRLQQYTVEELDDDPRDQELLKRLRDANQTRLEQYKKLQDAIRLREEPEIHIQDLVTEASDDNEDVTILDKHRRLLPGNENIKELMPGKELKALKGGRKLKALMPARNEDIEEQKKALKRTSPESPLQPPKKKRMISNPPSPNITEADEVIKDFKKLYDKNKAKIDNLIDRGNVKMLANLDENKTNKSSTIEESDGSVALNVEILRTKSKLNAAFKEIEQRVNDSKQIDLRQIDKCRKLIDEIKDQLEKSGIEQKEIKKATENAYAKLNQIILEKTSKLKPYDLYQKPKDMHKMRIKQNIEQRQNAITQAIQNRRKARIQEEERKRIKTLAKKTQEKSHAMKSIKAHIEKKRSFQPGTYKKQALHGDERSEEP